VNGDRMDRPFEPRMSAVGVPDMSTPGGLI
jgi:hypothetical protein